MRVGVVRESCPDEQRVALVPSVVPVLAKAGIEVIVETGAGLAAGYPDQAYAEKGAAVAGDRSQVLAAAEVLVQVRGPGANPEAGLADLDGLRPGQVLVGLQEPLSSPETILELARRGLSVFALELLPRTTRAQSMDVLSSMATVAGYKAVILAAAHLPRLFPMLMTAAGTITPARVLVIGAGVAGLQAIATARRLGAVVQAYDVRPAVRQEVESLGARFVDLELATDQAAGSGGYARAMDEEFYRRQRERLGQVVAESDVVITTAAVPGKQAPVLVTTEMVESMALGSVIVDLAAERGGNCELTRPGQALVHGGVIILGPIALPATVAHHASQMYARNAVAFLRLLARDGRLAWDIEDDIVRETLVAHGGEVTSARVRELLERPPAGAGSEGGA